MDAVRPCSSHKTGGDHEHHLQSIAMLGRQLQRLRNADACARQRTATVLYEQLSAFVAENFGHMLVEESYNNAVLGDHYSDAQIVAIEHALVGSMPPQEQAATMQLMLPAISAPEREAMLRGAEQGMPRDTFRDLLERLASALPTPDRERLGAAFC